jgi:drug/metabolite transporter (DMT)-like permease
MSHRNRLPAGEIAMLLAAVGYGVSTSVSVFALNSVRPADLAAIELTGGAALLFVVGTARGAIRRSRASRHLFAGSLLPGLAYILGDLGLARTSATSGSLLLSIEPLVAVVLALVFLREHMPRAALGALALGVAGSAVVALGAPSLGAGSDPPVGNVLVILSVVVAAVFLVVTRHWSDGGGGLNASAWQTLGGAVTAVPFVAWSWLTGGSRLPHATAAAWIACAGVLVSTSLAAVAFNWGIGKVVAVRATQLLNLTPVVGVFTAVVFLGERLVELQVIGGITVVLALVILVRAKSELPTAELVGGLR